MNFVPTIIYFEIASHEDLRTRHVNFKPCGTFVAEQEQIEKRLFNKYKFTNAKALFMTCFTRVTYISNNIVNSLRSNTFHVTLVCTQSSLSRSFTRQSALYNIEGGGFELYSINFT